MEPTSDFLAVARERFAARDYRAAALLLTSAVDSGLAYADTHHMLGLCYAMLEQREDALRAFDEAIRLNPRYVEAHLNRAIVLGDMGRDADAGEALTRAQELGRPDATGFPAMVANRLANMHAELGRAYRDAGSLRAATDQFRAALDLRPSYADVRLELARTLMEAGDTDGAIAALDTVLEALPDWLDAMLLRGLAAYLAGDLEQAKSVWDRASKGHPDEPRLDTYRSMLARRQSEHG